MTWWPEELDLHVGPPEAAMGTRLLDPDRWLLVDDDWTDQRDEASRLLRQRRHEVLVPADDGALREAALEVGARIDSWLAARHPELSDGEHADGGHALATARARVAEDLCLLTFAEDQWVLAAAAVCFPSHWRPAEKVGRPLAAVHDPVPGYPGALAGRVDTHLGRLRPGQGTWRRNWSIHDSGALFAPVPMSVAGAKPAPEDRWLRSEYQTLLRLEHSHAAVFTIRTQQIAIGQLAEHPEVCRALAAAARGWTPAQRRYKGSAVDEQLLAWLDQAS